MPLHIHNEKFKHDMFEIAANDFLYLLVKTVVQKEYFDVALSGGNTAKEFFLVLKKKLDSHKYLKKIRFFFSDERVTSLNNEESNAGNALRLLLNPLSISLDQFFPMFDDKNSALVCALNYEEILRKKLTLINEELPCFDLIYLGIGLNGHTASLFPHSEVLAPGFNENRLVSFTHIDGVKLDRITFMPRLINAAKQIYVMAYGDKKGKVINEILNGPLKPFDLPAQLILRNPHNQIKLMTAEINDVDSR